MRRIGHRGAKGYEPENTLLSFSKALQLNVDMIELDVHVCKIGDVVVIHDETVEGTTNGTGRVADMTLDDLRKLNADKGQRIPTLQEVLDLVDRRAKVNIELKEEGSVRPVFELLEKYVTERGWPGQTNSAPGAVAESMKLLSDSSRFGVLEYYPLIYAPRECCETTSLGIAQDTTVVNEFLPLTAIEHGR